MIDAKPGLYFQTILQLIHILGAFKIINYYFWDGYIVSTLLYLANEPA